MSDSLNNMLSAALQDMHTRGYAKGRLDAVKALSTSFHFVNDCGVLSSEDKKGYKIALDTIDATLRILERGDEESGN